MGPGMMPGIKNMPSFGSSKGSTKTASRKTSFKRRKGKRR